ncbi:MAG: hypothetical protein E4G96_04700 [Chrysiogenales bacterium]|nr:MAG: hypothetical protein E4G96_04700 [Chrysiogenales bacterium]
MINDGTLSVERVNALICIKEFIDRISGKNYIGEETARDIEKKYGVRPNVISWGDYFQTEMATSLLVLTDEEFDRALETLKFDMVAAWIIFSGKGPAFFEWVDNANEAAIGLNRSEHGEEEEEIFHLKILKDYYTDLGIENKFNESEMEWFVSFQEPKAI